VSHHKKKATNKRTLDRVRLAGTPIVPKGFKPFVLSGMSSEDDVVEFLRKGVEAGDKDAELLLDLLKVLTVNDLIVEGVIRIQK
jgi:hypothetical protein